MTAPTHDHRDLDGRRAAAAALAEGLCQQIARTSRQVALPPAILQDLHRSLRQTPWLAPLALVHLDRQPAPADPWSRDLALAEILLAAGQTDQAAPLAEACHAADPGDLKAQDTVFRLEHTRRHGPPDPDRVGHELAGQYCPHPWSKMDFQVDGAVTLCCSAWMPASVGDLFTDSVERLWNGPLAQDIRRTVADGSYRYCGKLACSFITGRKLKTPPPDGPPPPRRQSGPSIVNLSFDKTCNLACPSCRPHPIAAREDERTRYDQVVEEKILPLLAEARRVEITGSGDPFASKTFRRLLRRLDGPEHANLDIILMTNGVLATEREWGRLGTVRQRIAEVNVSVDAARRETYDLLRRGGDFAALGHNLRHMAGLRAAGELRHLRLCFVVQAANFREMPDFVRWAEDLGVDAVHFQTLLDWGSMPPQAYRATAIHLPDHPEHAAFLEVLADPALARPMARALAWEFAHLVP
ncbi:SPASM domain-containing protein [Roseospirillum parvum]|uniref:4Fe-4S single cluster domain-containing protein n=1 Tax=Roseospirillum parvum TaxID=83401 RepID=A0A1G7TWN3_9PROT|nr:SPASM domain-containing protein [Roseospirillum parvum]SDG39464.1 4Fe-4S single cluster domain-containing protein [Roseospirillum parvum]